MIDHRIIKDHRILVIAEESSLNKYKTSILQQRGFDHIIESLPGFSIISLTCKEIPVPPGC